MVQLSEEEADKYRLCPVVLDFSSGFYIFPVSSLLVEFINFQSNRPPSAQ
jgi:hypothetical protein